MRLAARPRAWSRCELGAAAALARWSAGDPATRPPRSSSCRALLDARRRPAGDRRARSRADPLLRPARRRRARPPRARTASTRAEIAIRAVLGQQVAVAAARTQAGAAGRALRRARCPSRPARVTHLFPAPAALAALDPEAAADAARPRPRRSCAMAAALRDGLDPRDRAALPRAAAAIGPWTADYVAMRCGDPDVLLETDLGVRRGFARLATPPRSSAAPSAWRPWRSYAVQHLWSLA